MIKVNGLVVSRIPINGKETLRIMNNGQQLWSGTGLPVGYTLLEYIESTGTQYIDTGFKPNQDTRVDVLAEITSTADAANGIGFIPYGAGASYFSNAFECYSVGSQFEFNYANQYDFIGSLVAGHKIRISHNKGNISVLNEESGQIWTKTFTYNSFSAPYNMTICAINRGSAICGQQKIYSCQIYNNGTIVRDYIPCKNPSGVCGLYDKVNKVFYGSASGTPFTGA